MPPLAGYNSSQTVSVTGNKPASSLPWFPMLVSYDTSTELNDFTLNAGLDIAFTLLGDDTELPYERILWRDNGANIDARFWVRVPSVSSSSDTDLRIYIGQSGGTAYSPVADAWDENGADNFAAVWHLNNSLVDSTGNGFGLTNNAATGSATGGQIAGYYNFDGANENLTVELPVIGDYPFTFSCLGRAANITELHPLIFVGNKAVNNAYVQMSLAGSTAGDPLRAFIHEYDGAARNAQDGAFSANTWYWCTGRYASKASRSVRLNDGAVTTTTTGGGNMTGNDRTSIGMLRDSSPSFAKDVRIEEARIATVVRSDAWSDFEYDNIFNYGATITHGDWLMKGSYDGTLATEIGYTGTPTADTGYSADPSVEPGYIATPSIGEN